MTSPTQLYLCACGCGKETPIAKFGHKKNGYKRGEHTKFLKGHKLKRYDAPVDLSGVELRCPLNKKKYPRPQVDQPPCGSYKIIPLTRGFVTKVSNCDYEFLNKWNWSFTNGYARRAIRVGDRNKHIAMHRAIMGHVFSSVPFIDHINGDPLDNRRENLRVATHHQNMMNRRRNKETNTSVKGVMLKENGKFQAYICLGTYETLEEARSVRERYARMIHGEFFKEGE